MKADYTSNGMESVITFDKAAFSGKIYGVQLFQGISILKNDLKIKNSISYQQNSLKAYVKLYFKSNT